MINLIKKSLVLVVSLASVFFVGCGAEKKVEDKKPQNQSVNSNVGAEEEVEIEEKFFIDARNQELYSGIVAESGDNLFYTLGKENNRIYRANTSSNPGINKKSEVSMMSGEDLIVYEDKIYYCNDQDNGNIYFFEIDKFNENLKPVKFNNFKSRDLVSTKDGIYFINESDGEKVYFKSYDGEIEKAVSQDRAAKYIISDYVMYYQNAKDEYNLYAMDLIEKKTYKLTNFSVESFTTVAGVIVASNSDDNNSLYKISGTDNIEKISNHHARNIKTDLLNKNDSQKTIYFTDDIGSLYKMNFTNDNKVNVDLVSNSSIEDYYFTANKIITIKNPNESYESISK